MNFGSNNLMWVLVLLLILGEGGSGGKQQNSAKQQGKNFLHLQKTSFVNSFISTGG